MVYTFPLSHLAPEVWPARYELTTFRYELTSRRHDFVIYPVFIYWATVCKIVRPMPSDRCPVLSVCLSVCDVGALWPNGWTDQDETWHTGRPRPWPHCVRWGPSSPSPIFGPFLLWQMAGCIKMPLDMEVGLSPGDFVLDGDPVPLIFQPMFIIVIVISLEH